MGPKAGTVVLELLLPQDGDKQLEGVSGLDDFEFHAVQADDGIQGFPMIDGMAV